MTQPLFSIQFFEWKLSMATNFNSTAPKKYLNVSSITQEKIDDFADRAF
jgi:hypothetical protein